MLWASHIPVLQVLLEATSQQAQSKVQRLDVAILMMFPGRKPMWLLVGIFAVKMPVPVSFPHDCLVLFSFSAKHCDTHFCVIAFSQAPRGSL